jgi:hypothetical protein
MHDKFLTMITMTGATLLATGAALVLSASTATAQETEDQNPYGYDRSFITRPDHKKPTNPFAAKAEDFSKNSYRRMLLNSPFASSSIGLGANAANKLYDQNAYTYMNPDSFKANDATPEEVNRYIDHVYSPKVSTDKQGYMPDKNFDQANPFKNESENRFSSNEANPFGNTFERGPGSPYMQKETKRRGIKSILNMDGNSDSKMPGTDSKNSPTDTKIDTTDSNF